MSTTAVIWMILMLFIYFGGFIYFALQDGSGKKANN
ncbi:hypothetical protein Toce_0362 [Thermosediminibacter oceani DSM 16646]|uniref:Uncharacterized protein n=1 Tax=Thermosediminibacter oceani (strain ATCC BAA-1034 / DSM 16646 / JW/IW-1228P) TaxID=555079 RepID=D9S0X9_THEOJ|nr:hypothetical protein Toce_0362 [Thermosediminibacter oceani DSM 16646]